QQQTGVSDRLNDVFFINENTGWVVGGDFSVERIFKTTNGGTNWNAQTSNTANKLFSVYFINENTGWSVGGPSSPKIIKTTNGGTNWFTHIGGETIIKTTNGGITWFSQSSGDTRYLRDCYVKNSNTMIAVGQGGKIITTTNGGVNWIIHSTGSTIELWSVDFPSDTTGYAIGTNVVLKTTNGGVTFVAGQSNNIPDEFKLFQNYPNPFNPRTNIKYQITNNSFVNLKVFDVLGKEVATLVNQNLQPGEYEVNFNSSDLTSGIYFYKLKSGDFSEIKKMLLIK
ncbi:MAG: T9SS type A sorting domain-containing protein, partial [Ignavibacteriae bacterium]|nr:T9SS type A sorting domain-containing protein [Ignavibacteriota bacterium]